MKKVFIVFLTSFLLGALTSWYGFKIINQTLGKSSVNVGVVGKTKLDMRQFWDVYNVIEKEYYSHKEVEKNELVQGAIDGMVNALKDKHSEFMTPDVTKKFNEILNGDFEGIGAVVDKVPLGIKIERILKGSPAKKYGVRAKDIIIKADEHELAELDMFDAISKIKGPAGTQVILSILRPGEIEMLEIAVIREKIHIPSVEEKYFEEENIGYISLNMYGTTTPSEFRSALKNIKESNVDGLIIDLRDNGGGYLQSAVEILSEFVKEGELLVKTKYRNSFLSQVYYSVNSEGIYDKKIVILVNGNSASASEITAGALREYDKAILVGEKTYGKGSVQQPFNLEDGSLLKLTVAKWFTPKGKNIDEEGIEPDIKVSFEKEDYENKYDRQLEEAKKILRTFIEKDSIGLTVEGYKKLQEK